MIAVTAAKTTTKVVALGTTTSTVTVGHTQTVVVSLNSAGKRLLATYHTLKANLTTTQSGRTVASRTITFKAEPKR